MHHCLGNPVISLWKLWAKTTSEGDFFVNTSNEGLSRPVESAIAANYSRSMSNNTTVKFIS
eukprot:gene22457-8953_t